MSARSFNSMVNSGYFMYMAEAEGLDSLVSTRTARINAAKREFENRLNCGYTDVTDEFRKSIHAHKLTESDLTYQDKLDFQAIADRYQKGDT